MQEALNLLIVGMSVVFGFLVALTLIIFIVGKVINALNLSRTDENKDVNANTQVIGNNTNELLSTAIIGIAIKHKKIQKS